MDWALLPSCLSRQNTTPTLGRKVPAVLSTEKEARLAKLCALIVESVASAQFLPVPCALPLYILFQPVNDEPKQVRLHQLSKQVVNKRGVNGSS